MKRLSLRGHKDLSLFFKTKRTFCSATFMSYFSPSLLCPLLLGVLPASLLQIWVLFEQPFSSSSWERKNTLSSSLFPLPTSKLPVWSCPVCLGEELLWMAYPVPRVGGRDNRSTSAPSGCFTCLPPAQGMSPRTCPDTLAKAEQHGLGAARRESPDTLSERLKNTITASEMVLLLWEIQLPSPVTVQWIGSSNVRTLVALHTLFIFLQSMKTRKNGQAREIKVDLPCWPHNGIINIIDLCYRSCKFGYIEGTLHHADIWHMGLANRLSKAKAIYTAMLISVSCNFLPLVGSYRNAVSIFMPRCPTTKAKTKEKGHRQRKSDLSESLPYYEYYTCWTVLLPNAPEVSHK